MTDRTSRAVAPVSAVCAAFRTQPSAYPPEATKPDVAPVCGSFTGTAGTEGNRLQAACGGGRSRKRQGSRLWICQGIKCRKDELVAVGNGRGNAGSRSVSRRIWV